MAASDRCRSRHTLTTSIDRAECHRRVPKQRTQQHTTLVRRELRGGLRDPITHTDIPRLDPAALRIHPMIGSAHNTRSVTVTPRVHPDPDPLLPDNTCLVPPHNATRLDLTSRTHRHNKRTLTTPN